jgi:LacI family transcriptional regulator
MIRSQALPEGKGLPSERKLSLDLSVSRGVVRAALRELSEMGLIESKPRCRPVVRSTHNIRPTGRRHIGIWLWPNTGDYAAACILKGIQSSELAKDIRLVIGHAAGGDWDSRLASEARFLRTMTEDPEGAGVIVWYLGGDHNLPALQAVRTAGIPMVFIDRLPPAGFSSDYVGTNNETAAFLAVQNLTNQGHRRVGLISNVDPASSVAERETGYQRALNAAGIPFDPDLIQRDVVDEPSGVEAALDHLLFLSNPPTGIFCINDQLALQAYEALARREVKVPEQISIIGFDGLLRWVPGGGYLTTVEQDFYRMGRLAAELVIERMTSGRPEAYKHLLLDAPLADHGSTASPITPPMKELKS